jgi:hypothetical protein
MDRYTQLLRLSQLPSFSNKLKVSLEGKNLGVLTYLHYELFMRLCLKSQQESVNKLHVEKMTSDPIIKP